MTTTTHPMYELTVRSHQKLMFLVVGMLRVSLKECKEAWKSMLSLPLPMIFESKPRDKTHIAQAQVAWRFELREAGGKIRFRDYRVAALPSATKREILLQQLTRSISLRSLGNHGTSRDGRRPSKEIPAVFPSEHQEIILESCNTFPGGIVWRANQVGTSHKLPFCKRSRLTERNRADSRDWRRPNYNHGSA